MSSGSLDSSLHTQGSPAAQSTPLQRAMDDLFIGLLNDVCNRLQQSQHDEAAANDALDELFLALRDRKLNSAEQEWRDFVVLCRKHPIMQLVHQDPFTFRAYSKPRGYAGDAVMMDYIYGREEFWPSPPAEPIGQRVFNYTTLAPASEGVRARRAFIARHIDLLAERQARPHILSIAAGHLRETNLSAAIRRKRVGRLVALDADVKSLEEIRRCYGHFEIETVPTSFRTLLSGRTSLGEFDLVYSTGLFDYLDERVGSRLVSIMFEMLRPGGSLVVANFLPGVRDVGYMEAYMDWNLIYRTRQEMIGLTGDIAESKLRDVRLFTEENQNIIFMQLTKS